MTRFTTIDLSGWQWVVDNTSGVRPYGTHRPGDSYGGDR